MYGHSSSSYSRTLSHLVRRGGHHYLHAIEHIPRHPERHAYSAGYAPRTCRRNIALTLAYRCCDRFRDLLPRVKRVRSSLALDTGPFDDVFSYDRYWMGRTAWSEVTRNIRTLSRLIWLHIPLRMTPKASPTEESRPVQEINQVMKEKRKAIDLLEGLECISGTLTHTSDADSRFAVALKHHLRSECSHLGTVIALY